VCLGCGVGLCIGGLLWDYDGRGKRLCRLTFLMVSDDGSKCVANF
jgi:hypothetical protein